MWATQRCWSLLFLRRRRGPRRSFPRKRAGWRILCFILFLFRLWPMGPRSRHNSKWLTDRERLSYIRNPRYLRKRERRRYVPMPQSWTIAGCLGLVLISSVENLMSGCTCRSFIPVCTRSGSGMQNPLENVHWRFLLKSEMIGASKYIPYVVTT